MSRIDFWKNGFIIMLAWMMLASCHAPKEMGRKHQQAAKAGVHYSEENRSVTNSGELKKKYAAALNTSIKELKNVDLYRFVDEWQGVPYKWGGNDKDGVDCSGFVCRLYASVFNKKLERTVAAQFAVAARTRNLRKLKEGDLVYFKTGSRPDHVGVYLNNGFFVHASVKSGVRISSLYEPYWKNAYIAALKENGI